MKSNDNERPWEQKLVLYHPNSKGSGAAMQLEPRINRRQNDRTNCFFLDMAAQKTCAGAASAGRSPATFDWEQKLTVKLGFADVCELLAVLEGLQDHAGGSRDGLYHDNGNASTVIGFRREAGRSGYWLGLSRKTKTDEQAVRISMLLSATEGLGLRHIFQTGLFLVLFHTHLFGGLKTARNVQGA